MSVNHPWSLLKCVPLYGYKNVAWSDCGFSLKIPIPLHHYWLQVDVLVSSAMFVGGYAGV
jgi:hypothetical protein